MAEDDEHRAERRVDQDATDALNEQLVADREQRLGAAHPARFAGGEHEAGNPAGRGGA
jgi:hypothetical protein